MRKPLRSVAVMAGLLVVTAGSQAFALCIEGDNIFPIFQCGFRSWFASAPRGSGPVAGTWWQIGYGNLNISIGTINAALEGTGITPASPVTFSGNDAGMGAVTLSEARFLIGPPYNPNPNIPVGAGCINYEDSWGEPGVDGCVDNKRTTAAYDNDNLLNPYFGGPHSYYPAYTREYLMDYPMGFLLTEGTGRFFAIAFIANKTRNGNPMDPDPSFFDLGEVTNGDPNPLTGQNDIIPWQPVPKPNVDAAAFDDSDVTLALSWNNVKQVSDGTSRPSPRLVDPGGATGVGTLDMGNLVRYQLEALDLNSLPPGSVDWGAGTIDPNVLATAAFVPQGPPIPDPPDGDPKVLHTLTLPVDTAIRVRTLLGRTPRATVASLESCRLGRCGDLGVEATRCSPVNFCRPISPPVTIIPLVSERAIEMRAVKTKGGVLVTFRTTSEQTVTGIEILGVDPKGDLSIRSIAPQQGTTGAGARYEVSLKNGELKGAKSLKVRLNGPGFTSEPFPVE